VSSAPSTARGGRTAPPHPRSSRLSLAPLRCLVAAPQPDQTVGHAQLPISRQQFELAFEDCGGTWYVDDPQRAARPINCVSWYEAFAFCIWDEGRLPTEAEWEYAAAGGSERRRYPWGDDEPARDRAVFACRFESSPACSESDLPPVGNAPRGAGRFGHQDLAGSLWEWTLDQYAPYGMAPCSDCAVLDGGEGRVFRGGGYRSDDVAELRTTHRLGFLAEQRDATRGFRCARATHSATDAHDPP
jgi:formylglycine-generating enzyme required for sulfatase activity